MYQASREMTGRGSVSRQARRIEKKKKQKEKEEGRGERGRRNRRNVGRKGRGRGDNHIIIANISLQWKLERGGYSNW